MDSAAIYGKLSGSAAQRLGTTVGGFAQRPVLGKSDSI
jgi:hypothetical protein